MKLSQRPIREGDQTFLFQVFATTRPDITLGLPPEQAQEMMRMQYQAQARHYNQVFPQAQYCIILGEGRKIGRLYVDRSGSEIRILDIALLPDFRSQGIGTRLVQELQEEAKLAGLPLRLHVELGSRKVKFYERLGFEKIGEIPSHQHMEWTGQAKLLV